MERPSCCAEVPSGAIFREVAPRGTSAKHNRFTPYEVDVANVAPYASAGVRV